MANGGEGERILDEGRDFVAFEVDFGDVLAGDQGFRMADDDIPGCEAKFKKSVRCDNPLQNLERARSL